MTRNRTARRSRALFVASVLAAVFWSPAASSNFQMRFRTAWMYLGDATLADATDHIRIEAKPYIRTFSDLQIRVRQHAVHVLRIRIYFTDETSQDIRHEHRVPARGTSRTIDLEGGDRSIDAIEFWCKPQPPGEAALLLVYARG
jgi:hypothetical protein